MTVLWVVLAFAGLCILFKVIDVLHERWAWRRANEEAARIMRRYRQ